MLQLIALVVLAQSPAIRRATPASDDPGMVVRQVGTVTVTGTTTMTGAAFDGGNIGYMRMPDGGPLEVTVAGGSLGGGWAPDGGFIGTVALADGGGVFVTNPVTYVNALIDGGSITVANFPASQAVTGPLTDAQLRAAAVPVSGPATDTQLRATPLPVSGSVTATVASTTVTNTVAVSGPLTDTQLRATPVLVSGSVTTGGLTDAQLRASTVPVNLTSTTVTGSVAVTGPVTDTQLRASAVPVSGTVTALLAFDAGFVSVANFPATQAVTGPLTDSQLRASAVPVSGTVSTNGLTDTQLRASAVPVSGSVTAIVAFDGGYVTTNGLTDAQLRASAVPVSLSSTTVTGSVAVTGPLTDAQARATPLPVSGTVTSIVAFDGGFVSVANFPASQAVTGPLTDTQLRATSVPVSLSSTTVTNTVAVTGPLTDAQLRATPLPVSGTVTATVLFDGGYVTTNGLTDTQLRATPVPVSGTVTSTIAFDGGLVTALQGTSPWVVSGTVTANAGTGTLAVSAASLPLPSGASTSALQTTGNTSLSSIDTKTPSLGQGLMAASSPVVIASNQSAVPVSGSVTTSGTATVTQGTSRDGGYNWGVNVDNFPASQVVTGPLTDTQLRAVPVPVSGTVSTGGLTDTQLRATAVPVSLTSTTITGSVAVTGPLTDTQLRATAVPVSGSVTTSGTVTATQGTSRDGGYDWGVNVDNFPASQAVTGPLTDTQLRASAVPVSLTSTTVTGNVTVIQPTGTSLHTVVDSAPTTAVTGPLTDTQLRASAVPVTANAGTNLNTSALALDATLTGGTQKTLIVNGANNAAVKAASTAAAATDPALVVAISPNNTVPVSLTSTTITGSVAVTGPLTDTQLRASAVPVSLASTTVTGTVAVSGPLTDTQLRASAVPVSGSVTTGGLTDTQLRASAVPVSLTSTVANAGTNLNTSALALDATLTGRLPAAAALADATANPSPTAIGTYLMGYNGTTWDRIRSSTTLGITVNVSNATLAVTQSGTWNVGLNAGTNFIGKTRLTDGTLDTTLLNAAPGSDTGQVSLPVRIISSLAGGAGGTSSSFGSAFPSAGTAAGFHDGVFMQSARVFDVDTSVATQYVAGVNLRVSAAAGSAEAAAGAGATSAATLRVVLPTDQTAIPVTLTSTTVTGSVAVTGPLTDAQLRATPVPISGTVSTGGLTDAQLRASVVPVSLAANQSVNVAQMGGVATSMNTGVRDTGTQRVTIATNDVVPVSQSGTWTNAVTTADATSSGSIAALNGTVSLALNGYSGTRLQITGTWVGTLQFEATVDGSTWIPVNAVQAGTTTIPQTTTTNGTFSPTPAGFATFRVNATAWTSGTAVVSIRASAAPGGTYLNQSLPSFAVIPTFKVDQTTPGTTNAVQVTGALPTGTNSIGSVTQATGTNLHTVTDTGSTTTVTGNVTAVQATGANLHVVVDTAPTTTVTGPLTDTQLRASVVPVSLAATTVTGSVAVTGPLTDTQLRATPVPVSGTVTAANASVSTTGTAPPASATLGGASVTTAAPTYTTGQMSALSLTTGGGLRVDGSGTTQPVSGSVTANAGTNLNTSALALETSLAKLTQTQGSTTAGQSGPLAQSAVTSTYPTYVDATTRPLSQSTLGALRVSMMQHEFVFSTANSTAVQLAASATFTGTCEGVQSQPAYSLLVFSDQPGTFTINSYQDAACANITGTQTFTQTANAGITRSGALNANYIKVTYQNTGASTTTKLVVDMAYGDIAPATQLNNTPVAINEINGTSVASGNGVTGAGSQRVTIASDNTPFTVTATQATAANLRAQTASESTVGSAVPTVAGAKGMSDGTNLQIPRVYDVDTSAGFQYAIGAVLVGANFGGGQQVQSAANATGFVGIGTYSMRKLVFTPTTTAVSCGTTATAAPTTALASRLSVTFVNNSTVTIYLGGSGVTVANGLPLTPGASFSDEVESSAYFCRVASGTAELRVLEN